MKLESKVAPKVRQKTVLVYAVGGAVLAAVVSTLLFLYFNVGFQKDTLAKNRSYSSVQSGNWGDASTWGGTTIQLPLEKDVVTINSDHSIIRDGDIDARNNSTFRILPDGTLMILGNLIVDNGLTLNVDGNLLISGDVIAKNGAQLTVTGGGSVDITGDAEFGQGSQIVVDGDLNIGGTLTLGGGNSNFTGGGTVTVGGSGCDYWDDGASGTCNPNTTLPVELLSFTAQNENGAVVITWETATELNNDFFTIERSATGTEFSDIAEVKGNGTTKEASQYEFVDYNPLNGTSYYRLVQTDFDGTSETFKPVSVTVEAGVAEGNIEIYPNPLAGNVLRLKTDNPEQGMVEIFGQSGNKVFSRELNGFDREEEMVLPAGMLSGLYYVKVKTAGSEKSFKLIKK